MQAGALCSVVSKKLIEESKPSYRENTQDPGPSRDPTAPTSVLAIELTIPEQVDRSVNTKGGLLSSRTLKKQTSSKSLLWR